MTKTDASISSTLDEVDFNNLLEAVSVTDASAQAPPPGTVLFPPGSSSPNDDEDNKNLYGLICIEHKHYALAVCGGKIGGSQFRFCTRPKPPNLNSCTTNKHRSQFHSLQHGRFYIIKNNTSAFMSPYGDISKMTIEQVHNFRTARKTIGEWRNIFTLINSDHSESAATILSETNRKLYVLSQKLPLKSPRKIKSESKLDQGEDDSFFEADDGQKFEIPDSSNDEWSSLPDLFRHGRS